MRSHRTVSIVFPFSLLLVAVLACTIPPDGGHSGTTPSSPNLQFNVRQEAKLVWAGSEDPLPELSSLDFEPLAEGARVSTDWQGEALLQAEMPTGVCQVYLFQESSLVKRACPRAQAGNSSCLEEGSAVYNNCSNHIVMTPSAEATLLGTWVSVTYLPDQEMTLFIVAEGAIEVRPVTNLRSRTLSAPVRVNGQQFLLTSPDSNLHAVVGLPPREPLNWEELAPVIDELDLQPWIERTGRHADLDTVPAPPLGEDAIPPTGGLEPPEGEALPDLVIDPVAIREPPLLNDEGRIQLPISVVVRNKGESMAGPFKLGAEYAGAQGTYVTPFAVPGQESAWYPFVEQTLAPGDSLEIQGDLSFDADLQGQEVTIVITADSCAGDELMPEFCRVEEADEANNSGQLTDVVLKRAEQGSFMLVPVGKPFDDVRVQEALWHLAGPADLVHEFLDQPDAAVFAADADGNSEVDLAKYSYDPEVGLKLLREAGYTGNFGLLIIAARGDDLAVKLAELIQARLLEDGGIKADLSYAPATEIGALLQARAAAGQPALGVFRR